MSGDARIGVIKIRRYLNLSIPFYGQNRKIKTTRKIIYKKRHRAAACCSSVLQKKRRRIKKPTKERAKRKSWLQQEVCSLGLSVGSPIDALLGAAAGCSLISSSRFFFFFFFSVPPTPPRRIGPSPAPRGQLDPSSFSLLSLCSPYHSRSILFVACHGRYMIFFDIFTTDRSGLGR